MATSKKQQAAIAMSMKAKGTKPKKAQYGSSVKTPVIPKSDRYSTTSNSSYTPPSMKPGGSLGNKSVQSGYDNNPGVTRADFVAMGKGQAKAGGSYKKGGTTRAKMTKKKK
jgi:hypothetical protein